MNLEELQNIISQLNSFLESEDENTFAQICKKVNVSFDPARDDFDEALEKAMANIINMVENDNNMKAYLYENIAPTYIVFFPSSPENDLFLMKRIDSLDSLSNGEEISKDDLGYLMQSLSPEKQAELLKNNHKYKAYINIDILIANTTQNERIDILPGIPRVRAKQQLIQSLENDDDKVACLKEINLYFLKADIIRSLKTDEAKLKAIDTLTVESDIADAITYLSDVKKQKECLSKLSDDHNKSIVIQKFTKDEDKIEMLPLINNNAFKFRVIQGLSTDKAKLLALQASSFDDSVFSYAYLIVNTFSLDSDKLAGLPYLKDYNRATIIQSFSSDSDKLAGLAYLANADDTYKINIINTLSSDISKAIASASITDEFSLDKLNFESEELKKFVLSSDSDKANYLKQLATDDEKLELLVTIHDPVYRKFVIETFTDKDKKANAYFDFCLEDIQITQERKEQTKDYVIAFLEAPDDIERFKMIQDITSDEEKLILLNTFSSNPEKAEIIKTFSSDAIKISALSTISDSYYKAVAIQSFSDEKNKLSMLSSLINDSERDIVVADLSEDNKILALQSYTDDNRKLHIIQNLSTDEKKISALTTLEQIQSRRTAILTFENDSKKIDTLLTFCTDKTYTDEELSSKKDILLTLLEGNQDVLQSINIEFLDEDYIEFFGKQRFEQMACYSEIQEKVCLIGKDDELRKFDILKKCTDLYIEENGDKQWNILTSRLLDSLSGGSFDTLLHSMKENNIDVDSLSQDDLTLLTNVLTSNNIFNIQNINDLRNFDNIKKNVCEALVTNNEGILSNYPQIRSMSDVDKKKLAILENIFGIDLDEANNILKQFGNDIDKITSDNLQSKTCIDYVNCLKIIMAEENSSTLDELWEATKGLNVDIGSKNPIAMEGDIKTTYFREYTSRLFQIQDGKQLKGNNIYEAGVDFNMLISSVHAYYKNSISPENFEEEWNVNLKASQGICTSFISNEMMATAPVPFCCYGFSSIKEDSLLMSGSHDIGSKSDVMIPTSWGNEFLTPQEQINKTTDSYSHHNEMVVSRFNKDGSKVQPDYLVAFRKNGHILHEDYLMQAQEDFNGIPIVIIDVDKCLINEKMKVLNLLKEYKLTGSEETKAKIFQKIRNNEETAGSRAIGSSVTNVFETEIAHSISAQSSIASLLDDPSFIDLNNIDIALQILTDKFASLEASTPYMENPTSTFNQQSIQSDESAETQVSIDQYHDAYRKTSQEKISSSMHFIKKALQMSREKIR